MRRMLTVYVDDEVIKKAKELGLNLSRTVERLLKLEIKKLEGDDDGI